MTQLMDKRSVAGEEDASQFLREIRTIPRLTVQEERELAVRCAAGDEDAIRKMVNANLRLVVSVAREYAGRGVPLLDLIQEGSIGLLTAARKFDHTREYRFSTYATKWIRQGITKFLTNQSGLIRVPEHTAERMRKIETVRAKLRQESGAEPTAAEIGRVCGLAEEKVSQLLRMLPEVCSLDIPAGDRENGTLGTLIEDSLSVQPQEELVRRELTKILDALLGALEERQRQILRMHFGMEDGCCYSLEEIAKHMCISKERVRQIERQAMEKLQKMGTSMGLEDFLE